MANIPGTVLAAMVSPGDTTATFATHEDIYGKGGLMTFTYLSSLTGIPVDRQKVGMLVYINETGEYYKVNSTGSPLTDYSIFDVGGGGSSDIIDLTFKSAYTTYYHELNYDSITTDLSSVQIYEDNTKVTHLFEKFLTYTSTALLTGISITDKVNNNTLTKTLSYDGNDNLISTTRIYT